MKNTHSYPLSDKSYFGLDLQVAFFVFRVPPSCFAAATLGCGLSCLWRLFCSNGTPVSLISAGRCSSRSAPSSRSSSSSSSSLYLVKKNRMKIGKCNNITWKRRKMERARKTIDYVARAGSWAAAGC